MYKTCLYVILILLIIVSTLQLGIAIAQVIFSPQKMCYMQNFAVDKPFLDHYEHYLFCTAITKRVKCSLCTICFETLFIFGHPVRHRKFTYLQFRFRK